MRRKLACGMMGSYFPVMAFNRMLADRVTDYLTAAGFPFEEKKMMGGLCYMVRGKMGVGVMDDRLMVRLDPAVEADARARPGCVAMDFTGRPMKGYVFVHREGWENDGQLRYWMELALEFNPRAKSWKR